MKIAFNAKQNELLIIFKRFLLKQAKPTFLEGESPALSRYCVKFFELFVHRGKVHFHIFQDYPSIGQLKVKLRENKVIPIFAVTKGISDIYQVGCFILVFLNGSTICIFFFCLYATFNVIAL